MVRRAYSLQRTSFMEKWLLLMFTAIGAYVTYDSFRWRDSIKRAPFSVISSMWKGNLTHLSAAEQEKAKAHVTSFMGGGQFPWIFLLVTIVCGVFAARAFFA